jgi:D-psicose/D-tagatose/L-ribulose 3-epimerase
VVGRERSPIGVHALVWAGGWSEPEARRAVSSSRAAGFDFVEIPLLDPTAMDVPVTRRILQDHDMAANGCLGLAESTDIAAEDPDVVARGDRLLHDALAVVRDLGGAHLCGVLYGALGEHDQPVTDRGRANSIGVIQRLADTAAESGMSIALEVVNRYESNLLNTAEQAMVYIDAVDRANVVCHLDTYHMNIEEEDMARPVLRCGSRLGYVHVGESHRGYLGTGTVDFASFFGALSQVGYRGPITFESFSSAVVDPVLSTRLAIWRDLWSDSGDVARQARKFIDGQCELAGLTADRSRSAAPTALGHADQHA